MTSEAPCYPWCWDWKSGRVQQLLTELSWTILAISEFNLIHLRVCHLAVWRYYQPLKTLQWHENCVFDPWGITHLLCGLYTAKLCKPESATELVYLMCWGSLTGTSEFKGIEIIEYVIRSWHLLTSSTFFHWCLTRNCEYVIALCSLTWLTFARDLLNTPEISMKFWFFFCGPKMV